MPPGTRVERYWQLEYLPKHRITEDEAAAEVRRLLTEAVRKRLISEVPLGAFFSGGVDSSAVVALMAGLSSDAASRRSRSASTIRASTSCRMRRRVAERYGCDHHEFEVHPNAIEILPSMARHYGEPYADSSAIPSFYLAQLTRQHVTVALNGDGGDEAFAGYGWHLAGRLAERWQRLPSPLAARRRERRAIAASPPAPIAARRCRARRASSSGAGQPRPEMYRACSCRSSRRN